MTNAKLFENSMMPTQWIIFDGAEYWAINALSAKGWETKRPYKGLVQSLKPVPAFYAAAIKLPFKLS